MDRADGFFLTGLYSVSGTVDEIPRYRLGASSGNVPSSAVLPQLPIPSLCRAHLNVVPLTIPDDIAVSGDHVH